MGCQYNLRYFEKIFILPLPEKIFFPPGEKKKNSEYVEWDSVVVK